jgi:hypothetical protein
LNGWEQTRHLKANLIATAKYSSKEYTKVLMILLLGDRWEKLRQKKKYISYVIIANGDIEMSNVASTDPEGKELENLCNQYKNWINQQEALSDKEKSNTKNIIDLIRVFSLVSSKIRIGIVVTFMTGFQKGLADRIKERTEIAHDLSQ